ncbi:MAG: AraC family transcriptional regulator [Cyanobacteria bacterium P01_D01_bin.128]
MPPRLITTADQVETVFSAPPLLTTGDFHHGVYLDCRWEPASETEEVATPWHTAVVFTHLPEVAIAERKLDGRVKVERVHSGDVLIIPAHVGQGAKWNVEGEFVSFVFEPTALAQTITSEAAPILKPHFATQDLLMLQLALAVKKSLATGNPNGLYLETLTQTLAVHLLETYSEAPPASRLAQPAQRLDRYRFSQVIDYIYAHLGRDISLHQLAQLVGLSPHHFSQLFKHSTGLSPYQYVIHCRVNRAKALLKNSREPIAAIAHTVGFTDQSHLNRHFKRIVGVTPRQFRQG